MKHDGLPVRIYSVAETIADCLKRRRKIGKPRRFNRCESRKPVAPATKTRIVISFASFRIAAAFVQARAPVALVFVSK
jgi:hypothetical protein